MKENYEQGEKVAFWMGENNYKWSNWQIINLQNVQAAHVAQFQKIKDPIMKWAKSYTDISPKKAYRWLTNTWKDSQHQSLSEIISKPQWVTISPRSKWLLSKSLQRINAGEGVEKGNPLTLLVGMQTSTATMENTVEIP